MANTDLKSVDEYIGTFPDDVQVILGRVRRLVRKELPDADEVISYQIPAYKVDGRVVIHFAGFAEHFSLYPATERLVSAFGDELKHLKSGKATIRFPYSEPVPAKLIERIVRFRVSEVDAG